MSVQLLTVIFFSIYFCQSLRCAELMVFASPVGDLGFGARFSPREPCVVRAACCEDKHCDDRKAVLCRPLSRTSACGVASFVISVLCFCSPTRGLQPLPRLSYVHPWRGLLCLSRFLVRQLVAYSLVTPAPVHPPTLVFFGAIRGKKQDVSAWCGVLCLLRQPVARSSWCPRSA